MEKNIFYRAGCLELPQIRAETQDTDQPYNCECGF